MNRIVFFLTIALVMSVTSALFALDKASLIGKWQLVEPARDKAGQPCPFVSQKIEFTKDGRLLSLGTPVVFWYKVNPDKTEVAEAIKRNPELMGMGMEIILAMQAPQGDWSKAPIVYGVQLKDTTFIMKVSGYSPARYVRQK